MADNEPTDDQILEFFRRRPDAKDMLGQLIKLEEADTGDAKGDSLDRIDFAMFLAAFIAGDDAINLAIGERGDNRGIRDERGDKLWTIRRMLDLVDSFFAGPARDLLWEARDELEAILAGDYPALFAKLERGRKGAAPNRYRLAKLQARALAWDAFLKCSTDLSAGAVHSMVHDAFGADHDAYRRWKRPITEELGADYLDGLVGLATGRHRGRYMGRTFDEAKQRLARDGAAYKAEQRRFLDVVR